MDSSPADADKIGKVGRAVATNIRRLRRSRGLTLKELAALIAAEGRTASLSAISKTECGQRRMDVDDLVAYARVLNVAPADLLTVFSCTACGGAPPKGFTCNTCGTQGEPVQ